MPVYEYRGLNKAGKNVKGTIDAENNRNARGRLKKQGIYVIDLKDKSKAKKKKRASNRSSGKSVDIDALANMTRQLATLLKANVPLVDSLGAVAEQTENPTLSEAIGDCKNMVNEGLPLYKALGKYPNLFDKIYVSMSEAGEMSGTLDVILLRLAEFTEAQSELTAKVKSAMIYPIIMVIMTIGLLVALFVFVIPSMVDIFNSFPELELPWYTQVVIETSNIMVNYYHIMGICGVGGYFLFHNWKNTTSGHRQWDAIRLKLPVWGKMNRLVAVSRFSRTLATLLNGGVPMLDALDIVRNVVNNDIIAEAIDNAKDHISEGESIAGPLKASGQFPPLVIHMIGVGEKTGDLENMLTQVSDAYDFQVKTQIEGLTSMLEPLMMILMGGVIGMIVVAVIVPMMDMMDVAG